MKNKVHCGDNLKIMETLPSDSIDLIYIDPPFNTGGDFGQYNDRWATMEDYLDFMDERLLHCHRLLKKTGSLYLHCDYRTNYKLRNILDEVFGVKNFVNEIIWCYKGGGCKKRFARKHDTVFLYSKTNKYKFNGQKEKSYTKSKSRKPGLVNLGNSCVEFYRDDNGVYTLVDIKDYWNISNISSTANERTNYPTQKPIALLERIIKASSNEGDIVADFFCGSGTTLVAAKNLGRNYLGCDMNKEAVKISKERLQCQ